MKNDGFVPSVGSDLKSSVGALIEHSRVEAEKDRVFDFGTSSLEESDVEVTKKPSGHGYEKSSQMTDDEFEVYQSTLSNNDAFTYRQNEEFWGISDPAELSSPDPRKVNSGRSSSEIQADRNRKARVTTDVDKWASDPDSYDYPFVDTPTEFTDEYTRDTLAGSKTQNQEILRDAGPDRVIEDY